MNPDIFFPERGDTTTYRFAIHTCNQCPVVEQCRDYGLELDQQALTPGIFGGMSQRQRRQLKKAS
jgi:hypothetical protein